jgi:ribonucleoside-diphosphate reductase alpha chain
LKYVRKTQSLSGKDEFYDVDAKIVSDYKHATGNNVLPDYFVSSADIDPIDRIEVQSVLQSYIDASISSTINLPNEATEEDVRNIYIEAWKHKLKGVTIYRSGCKREGILTTDKKKTDVPPSRNGVMKRSKELLADFYTVKIKGEQFIVLVGMMNEKPYEIFAFKPNIGLVVPDHQGIITKKSKMHYMYKSEFLQINELELANESLEERAATLYASMLLRHNVPINQIIKIAKKVNGNIASFSSAMCRILAKYVPNNEKANIKCPDCGCDMVYEEGCIHCPSCGYSKCGN